jgi:hypothetical protein
MPAGLAKSKKGMRRKWWAKFVPEPPLSVAAYVSRVWFSRISIHSDRTHVRCYEVLGQALPMCSKPTLDGLRLGPSADCQVDWYLSESSQGARISRARRRPRPRNRKRGNRGRGRFGCGSAAPSCIASCQPATVLSVKRPPFAIRARADCQSAIQQTRLSALQPPQQRAARMAALQGRGNR